MGYRKGYYRKDGTYVQGHYTSNPTSKPKAKSKKGCSLLILLLVTILSIEGCNTEEDCPTRKCSDYNNQAQAQQEFNENPSCLENLDSDDDGIPCENLSKN